MTTEEELEIDDRLHEYLFSIPSTKRIISLGELELSSGVCFLKVARPVAGLQYAMERHILRKLGEYDFS